MRSARSLAIGLYVAVSVLQFHVPAQAKQKPHAKPQRTHIVQGTAQLAGENGKFDVTYTLDKNSPLNFTLLSASYSPSRLVIGNICTFPRVDQKMLVINFTVQNPQHTDFNYDWSAIKFTVLDPDGTSYDRSADVGKAGTHIRAGVSLKPGQKFAAYTGFVVPEGAKIVKLIADRGNPPVLRVNLAGHIKPLTAPFADPADPTGATCLSNIPAKAGVYYPSGDLDVRYDSAAFVDGPLGYVHADQGNRLYVATYTIRNMIPSSVGYQPGLVELTLQTSDGEKETPMTVLKTIRNEQLGEQLSPGDEYTARAVFQLPQNVTGKSLTFGEGNYGKKYTVDVSAAH